MTSKQRYRLRLKLQRALSDTVLAVTAMDEADVGPNPANVAGIELAQEFLGIALKLPRPRRRSRPPADAIAATVSTVRARRVRETASRQRRRRRAGAAH
jgi:hypothetical protein